MEMTAQQKYSALLEELGALLQNKNDEITMLEWQVENLTEQLAKAAHEREEAIAELKALHKSWNKGGAE